MSRERYNRWQGLAIGQMSVAVALISGLSLAGLGAGLTLVQSDTFVRGLTFRRGFAGSMIALLLAALLSWSSVVTRTLDFRLTARKVRKDNDPAYKRSLTFLWIGPRGYGRLTWFLFWSACLGFATGLVLLVVSVALRYSSAFGFS